MFARLERYYTRAQQCVWLFYLLSAIVAYQLTYTLHQEAMNAVGLAFVWPVSWMAGRDLILWIDILSLGAVLTALGAAWKPQVRALRIGFALFTLMCGAFLASFGGINHLYHTWFWMAAILAALPTVRTRADKLTYCLTFATAQGMLLAFYSMAGAWKLIAGVIALANGVEGNFAPRGLALTLADRMLQTNTEPLLGRFFVDNYWLAWPMFLGMIYIQLVAVAIVFRPRLQVAWGLALIAFHIGTWLMMEIIFPLHLMVLIVFLVMSPFREDDWLQWKTLEDLPLIGFLFRPAKASILAVAS